jgi:hypothetical protein
MFEFCSLGGASIKAQCSQCFDMCKSSRATSAVANYTSMCSAIQKSEHFSPSCPIGSIELGGNCFFLDQSFRTRDQVKNVCPMVVQQLYGLSKDDAALAKLATLSTAKHQCVSVLLLTNVGGSVALSSNRVAPWCKSPSYDFTTPRAWLGLQVIPRHGPQWEDGTPFTWNNFLKNDAYSIINSPTPLHVMTMAGVQPGIWYSTSAEENQKAYTMCEFPAALPWQEFKQHKAEEESCNGKVLKVTVNVSNDLSAETKNVIQNAVATVFSAKLNVPSLSMRYLPNCSDIQSHGHSSRQLKGSGEVSTNVYTYTYENNDGSNVPTKNNDNNYDQINDDIKEETYVKSQDSSVMDSPPSVENVEVVQGGVDEGEDSDSDTMIDVWWIVLGVLCSCIAVGFISIVVLIGKKRKKRRDREVSSSVRGLSISVNEPSSKSEAFDQEGGKREPQKCQERTDIELHSFDSRPQKITKITPISSCGLNIQGEEDILSNIGSEIFSIHSNRSDDSISINSDILRGYDQDNLDLIKDLMDNNSNISDSSNKLSNSISFYNEVEPSPLSPRNMDNNSNICDSSNKLSKSFSFYNEVEPSPLSPRNMDKSSSSSSSSNSSNSNFKRSEPSFYTPSGVPVYSPTAEMLNSLPSADKKSRARKWTAQEDQFIRDMVMANGPKNWTTMGRQLQRTGAQCSQRWNKVLNPDVLHNIKWTAEEDRLLLRLHQLHPTWQNRQFAENIPNRTPTQCANRWNNKIDPRLRWDPWSEEEDAALIDGRSKGMGWSDIIKTYTCLHNRANISAKNRFTKLQKSDKKTKKKKN